MSDSSNRKPEIPKELIVSRVDGSDQDIEVCVVDITPSLAEKWLERNRSNRKVRTDRVDRYAEQIEDGEWIVSPDAVAFSYTGRLVNGQHRLKAVLRAGRSAKHIVGTGFQPEAFKIADMGIKRTGADVLRIEGFKSAEEMAAVCRLLALWHQGRLEELNKYENVRNSVIVDVATESRERLSESIEKVGANKKALNGLMPRSLMAFAYFAYKPSFPTKAEHFLTHVLKGESPMDLSWTEMFENEDDVKNPVQLLREKMRPNYQELSRKAKLALLVKAMNAYCLQRPLKQLRWRSNESFPELAAEVIVPGLAEDTAL